MSTLNCSIIEPYNAKRLFDLVNDINAYPEFVPNCTKSGIIQQHGATRIAFIEVAKLGIRKRFTTKNTSINHKQIDITLINGPFKYLNGTWQFIPVTTSSCKIVFNLQFKFKNSVLERAFSPLFKEIMCNMVNAFSHRAKQVYTDEH